MLNGRHATPASCPLDFISPAGSLARRVMHAAAARLGNPMRKWSPGPKTRAERKEKKPQIGGNRKGEGSGEEKRSARTTNRTMLDRGPVK